ncbi:hypothetical protein HDU98_002006 [Podochytrium sp. JEL0797]|nr:hypothetical protein HDU98_002006 [Podochytrium sp. JEL0797]
MVTFTALLQLVNETLATLHQKLGVSPPEALSHEALVALLSSQAELFAPSLSSADGRQANSAEIRQRGNEAPLVSPLVSLVPRTLSKQDESPARFIASAAFMDIFAPQFAESHDSDPAGDSLVNEMVHALDTDLSSHARPHVDLSSLYAAKFTAPAHTQDEMAALVESTFTNTLLGARANVHADGPDAGFLDAASEIGRLAAFHEEVAVGDALAEYVHFEKAALHKAAKAKNPFIPKQSFFHHQKPITLTVTQANAVSREMHDFYESQSALDENQKELLAMEIEYFFEEANNKEKTFLGAGGKVLRGIVQAIMGGSHASKSISESSVIPTSSTSTKHKSTMETINDAILTSTRESQWNSAKDGKIHTAPTTVQATTDRRVGSLDDKLKGKKFVYDAKEEGGAANSVDSHVDNVLMEGGASGFKLKAKL